MKEIKLLNGTGIEVTKDGVLFKGNIVSSVIQQLLIGLVNLKT
ncbi:hypothetical protein [Leuconostoc gelidum]|nr:hypothetical protein [Leuconostoc gelidum]